MRITISSRWMLASAAMLMLPMAATAQQTQTATLSGSVRGFDKQPLLTCVVKADGNDMDTLKLTPKGEFKATYKVSKGTNAYIDVNYDEKKDTAFYFYLMPGKSLTLTLKKDKKGAITPSYSGDTAPETEFENLERQVYTLSPTFSNETLGAFTDFSSCRDYITTQMKQLDKALLKVKNPAYVAEQKLILDQGTVGLCFNYAVEKQKKGHDMTQDKAFMDFVNTIDMNDTTQVRAILGYLDWRVAAIPDTTDLPADAMRLRLLKTVTQNQDVRNKVAGDIFSFQFIAQMFGADLSDVLPYVYKEFLQVSTDSAYCDYARKELARMDNQQEGKEAYPIPMHTIDGVQTTLRDVVGGGKYTYVDFWATWCGPCKKEIPHFARLAEKYKDSSIRFVSISIDQDKTKWETMLNSDKPAWPQYRIPTESQHLCNDIYGISGIPRFMIFDKEGRMIKASAPRPSEDKAEKLLESLK